MNRYCMKRVNSTVLSGNFTVRWIRNWANRGDAIATPLQAGISP
jgi:hypothetical protein